MSRGRKFVLLGWQECARVSLLHTGGGGGGFWCLFLSIHHMTCRHLTVFVSIHLMTCPFDNVFIHLMTYTFDSVCVGPSHDSTVTYYCWLCLSSHLTTCRHIWLMCSSHDLQTLLTVFVSFHLMTCRHFWQCLCSSISWPAHTFNSVLCPSISWPQTLLTMFVSIYLMTCRHIWQCVCPSHDLHTFDSLSSSISWPADTFDNFCVQPAYDLQTFLTVVLHPSISWHWHFLRWALLSPDNTTFSFSIFYKLFPGYNLILMPLFCISDTMTKTRSPRVVPKFDDARESSRALVDNKESKTAEDQRARNKPTS